VTDTHLPGCRVLDIDEGLHAHGTRQDTEVLRLGSLVGTNIVDLGLDQELTKIGLADNTDGDDPNGTNRGRATIHSHRSRGTDVLIGWSDKGDMTKRTTHEVGLALVGGHCFQLVDGFLVVVHCGGSIEINTKL